MGFSEDLERLALQERELVLPRLDSQVAWKLGVRLRKLAEERALANAIHYVLYKQPQPLVVWSPEHGRLV